MGATGATIHNRARYWQTADCIPFDVALWLWVNDGAGPGYKLPFPCKLTQAGWVNALNGASLRLIVRPTHWRPHFDLQRGR